MAAIKVRQRKCHGRDDVVSAVSLRRLRLTPNR